MPAAHPPEFRERAVELVRERVKPIAALANDLGISESCLRNWMAQADIESGAREGLTRAEREELVRLRRENRVLRMEKDLLATEKRSSADLTLQLVEVENANYPVAVRHRQHSVSFTTTFSPCAIRFTSSTAATSI